MGMVAVGGSDVAAGGGHGASFDVFGPDGRYQGSLTLEGETGAWLAPRIRHGHLYTVARDELGVESVVRVPLPPHLQ